MPIHLIITTPAEVFAEALNKARESSEKILKLADVKTSPLMPGETPDTRYHQIAKLGKQLAEAFVIVDTVVKDFNARHGKDLGLDLTADEPDKPDNPDAN